MRALIIFMLYFLSILYNINLDYILIVFCKKIIRVYIDPYISPYNNSVFR